MSRYIFNLVSKSKISIFVFVIYIVFALMSSCLSFVQPYLTGLFIDVLISTKEAAEVISFSVLVALLGIISAVINYLVGTFAIKLCGKYSFELLYTVTDNYLEGSYLVQKKDDPMYVTQKLYTDCNTVCSYFFNNVTIVPVLVLVIAAVMSILLSLNSIIFFLAVFLSLIYITVIFSYKKLIFRTQLEKKEYESKFVAKISEVFSSLLEIKLLSINKLALNNLKKQFDQYYPKYKKNANTTMAFGSIDTIVSTVFQSLVLIISGILILNHKLSIGQYIIICSYFNVLLSSFKKLITVIQSKQEANASWNRISQLYYIETRNGSEIINNINMIEIKDLVFRYENMKKDLLQIPYLRFIKGESYSLSGPNGAGKSTLCYILLGLYQTKNSIFYNGIDLSQLDIIETRKSNIYIVPQKPFVPDMLVNTYISSRLQKKSNYILEELDKYAIKNNVPVNLYDEVCSHVNENCRDLSGGEFKKLNLFLGLLSNSSILVLDEPTNDLDQVSINEIRSYIVENPLNKMIILVTHNESLRDACSQHIILS